MFRRSLVWFLAASFAVLVVVLGYAALGLREKEVTQDAKRALLSGRPERAITLIDRAWTSLSPKSDPDLRREMLRIRADAHIATENAPAVVRDLGELRRLEPDNHDLALEELRWILKAGQIDDGLRRARQMVADAEDDPVVRELCGDAAQLSYQEKIRKLVGEVGEKIPEAVRPRAFASLRGWLYGSRRSPSTDSAFRRFVEILEKHSPEKASLSDWRSSAQVIRERIDESQFHYQAALELGGQPVAAYRGLAYALEQGGRRDDLVWHAELYQRRYDHLYATDAAADLAEIYLQSGRYELAVQIEEDFIDREGAAERLRDGGFSERLPDLLLASARARFRKEPRDAVGLAALDAFCRGLTEETGIDLGPEAYWIAGLSAYANKIYAETNKHFRFAINGLQERPPTPRNMERRIEVTSILLEFAEERNWPMKALTNLTGELTRLQPDNEEALVENAERHLQDGSVRGAMMQLRRARRIASNSERIRRLEARVYDRSQSNDGLTASERALQRCLDTGNTIPSDVPSALLPLVAERALAIDENELALSIAQRVVAGERTWLWPRELVIEAELALGRNEAAAKSLRELLAIRPDDPEALDLQLDLRQKAGQPIDDLLHDLLAVGRTDTEVAEALFAHAQREGDEELLRHLAIGGARTHSDDPRALILLGRSQMDQGLYADARRTLQSATDAAADDDPSFREAILLLTIATAHLGPSPDLQPILQSCLDVHRTNTDGLTALARSLTDLDLHTAAYVVVERILADGVHDAKRNGEHFLLAAELALRMRTEDRAEDHLRAALAFPEAEERTQMLYSLLLWSQGRKAEAENAWIDVVVDDVSSACHAILIGQRDDAANWVRRQRERDPLNPCLTALQARIAPLEFPDPSHPAMELARSAPDELLQTLLFADSPLFARAAVDQARALFEKTDNEFARLLLAHALNRYDRPELAKPILLELLDDRSVPRRPAVFEEILISLEKMPEDEALRGSLWTRCAEDGYVTLGVPTKRMIELVLHPFRQGIAEGGRDSLGFFANTWILDPEKTGAGLDEVRLLISAGMKDEALKLCDRLRLGADEQRALLNLQLSLYNWKVQQSDLSEAERNEITNRADSLAENVLLNLGPFGGAVHYLLDRQEERFGPLADWPDPQARNLARKHLRNHLQLIRAKGIEDEELAIRSLHRLAELDGVARTIELIDGILRSHPTLMRLWFQRAQWQVEDGQTQEALDGIRWAYDLLPTHPIMLDIVELSLRVGRNSALDREVAEEALASESERSVKGRTVEGLLALRAGRLDEAIQIFESGDETTDPEQLYFLGLAYLRSERPGDAKQTLLRLVEDHPSSSRSEYAAHFARRCGD